MWFCVHQALPPTSSSSWVFKVAGIQREVRCCHLLVSTQTNILRRTDRLKHTDSFSHCWFYVFLVSENVKSFLNRSSRHWWRKRLIWLTSVTHVFFLYFETYSTSFDSVSLLVLFSFVTHEENDSGYTKLMITYSTMHHDLSLQQQIAFTQT